MASDALYDRIQITAGFLQAQGFTAKPDAALIFGSGLGAMSQGMTIECEIPYPVIPGFVNTTLSFHKGRLLRGTVAGKRVVAMDGRFHRYEGWSMEQITFPVRVMNALGAKTLLLSNISGCLNPNYRAGDLAVIVDHINLLGDNPLVGVNDERLGPRFLDMIEPYSNRLIDQIENIGMSLGIKLHRAVYAAMTGSSFETRAEYRMLRTLGADLIGMSSVPEVIAAKHCGMEVCALSLISDECFPDCLEPLDVPALLKRAEDGAEKIGKLFKGVLESL